MERKLCKERNCSFFEFLQNLPSPSSMCCSYQHTGYQIGRNITTSLAQDLCTWYTMICVAGKDGEEEPRIEVKVESDNCFKPASQQSLDLHSNETRGMLNALDIIKTILELGLNNTGNIKAIYKKKKIYVSCISDINSRLHNLEKKNAGNALKKYVWFL